MSLRVLTFEPDSRQLRPALIVWGSISNLCLLKPLGFYLRLIILLTFWPRNGLVFWTKTISLLLMRRGWRCLNLTTESLFGVLVWDSAPPTRVLLLSLGEIKLISLVLLMELRRWVNCLMSLSLLRRRVWNLSDSSFIFDEGKSGVQFNWFYLSTVGFQILTWLLAYLLCMNCSCSKSMLSGFLFLRWRLDFYPTWLIATAFP